MLLGLFILLLTAVVVVLAFWPAMFGSKTFDAEQATNDFDHDLAVYRDQLEELKKEAARGLISEPDAEQARAEIGRRLLEAETKSNRSKTAGSKGSTLTQNPIVLSGFLAAPLFAIATYMGLGSPSMDAQPLALRLEQQRAIQIAADEDSAKLRDLVASAEAHLSNNPNDGRGWDVLAPIYFRLGENEKAVDAYQRSLQINGEDARRLSGLAEAQVALTGGIVGEQSADLFQKAEALDANDGKSQFYLGLIEAQSGNFPDAARRWQAIVENSQADQSWRVVAENRLNSLNALAAQQSENGAVGAPALNEDTIDAASEMSERDRQTMIEGMVAGLDERLMANGGSVDEWQRLIRARLVLGQPQEAASALQSSIRYFSGDEAKQALMRNFGETIVLSDQEVEQ